MNKQMMDTIFKWFEGLPGGFPRMYLVGGVIRDWLLGKPIKDIDVVCRNAESCAQQIAGFKNVTVVPFKKKADAPCYRIVDRDNHDFIVDISEMRGGDIKEDLAYRDFCINAIAIELWPEGRTDVLIDPLEGCRDLKLQLIRLCSDHAICDDPLRMLRAIRFSAELGFTIEKNTRLAVIEQAGLLKESAPERIMAELIRIFNVSRSIGYVRQMDRLGLLPVALPEIQPMKGCGQNSYHHQDVWEHSLSVLEILETIINDPEHYFGDQSSSVLHCLKKTDRLPLLKMAALLHDVAKPVTCKKDPVSGKISFYGHDAKGKALIYDMALRMKISKNHRMLLERLAGEHIHVINLSGPEVKKNTVIRFFRDLGEDAILVIVLSMADTLSKKGPSVSESQKESYLNWCRKTMAEYFVSIRQYLAGDDLIGGDDLIRMGGVPGPGIGYILEKIRDARDNGMLKNRQDALEFARSMLQGMQHFDPEAKNGANP